MEGKCYCNKNSMMRSFLEKNCPLSIVSPLNVSPHISRLSLTCSYNNFTSLSLIFIGEPYSFFMTQHNSDENYDDNNNNNDSIC